MAIGIFYPLIFVLELLIIGGFDKSFGYTIAFLSWVIGNWELGIGNWALGIGN
ncbi:MAG: hypothetical protein QQW96_24755 [Tychonema bourrellyi B0820]|nr:hypothetical protein [Tychonema bourrellyi B0820]